MDKKQIQEKARNIGKFTLEVLDDLFGKRVLTFVYVLAAVFAASALFQVFTKYVYEEGFSTADALVATAVHTFTKIWVGILYGVLPAFGVFVVLYVIAKCIRNKNLRLKAEAEAVQKAEEAKSLEEERRLQERRKKFRFESVSDFIRAAVLDDEIKVVTEVHQDPIRKDYTELIKSTVECIRTLDFRMRSAQDDFQKAIKCPGVDPEFIEAQAYRLRLITATLGNRMNELITLLGEGHEVEK